MPRNFLQTLGIGSNSTGGGIPEINVQMMPEPNVQMYPGSNEQVLPGTNTQMYPGPQGQTIPATNAQMYPGTNAPMYPGTNEQMYPGTNEQMHPGTNEQMHPGTNEQMHPGTNEQMHPGTNAQMHPGANVQMHPGANAQMHPGTNAQTYPGTNEQMMPGDHTRLMPGATPQSMPVENLQMNAGTNEMIVGTHTQTMAGTNEQMMHGTQAPVISPDETNQRVQYNQETNEDDQPLTRVHSAFTPVGDRSKTSQILGVGCRLLWILYLLTAGLYLLIEGFRYVAEDILISFGVTMILVGIAFLIGAFYLGYKTIGRHCIPVVAMPQTTYSYQHFKESCRQPREHGLPNPITHGEQIELQQIHVNDRMENSDCPSRQQMVPHSNGNPQQMGSGLIPAGNQSILSNKVDQLVVPYDGASHSRSPTGDQLGPSPNSVNQQPANSRQDDQQLALSPIPNDQQGGSALPLKSPFVSREVQTSTPGGHKAFNLGPSEEQESPPSHESSKLLVNQNSL